MTSEKRVVRPYARLRPFQQVLEQWRLRIGPELLEPGQRLTLSSSSFRHDPAVLVCAEDDDERSEMWARLAEAAERIDVALGQLELIVIASTPYLKLADIVYRERLSKEDAIPLSIVMVGDEVKLRALCTPSGGADIEVAICLADELDQQPLRPRRPGTWLGRIRFMLRTELGELGFTPRRLTVDERERLGLSDDTMRFVMVDVELLLSEELDSAVDLYVDESVLSVLNQAPSTPVARAFQRQLFLDVMGSLVRAASGLDHFQDLQWADIEGSVLGHVVDAAANTVTGESAAERAARRETALRQLKTEPERFLAALEARVAPIEDVIQSLKGGDE